MKQRIISTIAVASLLMASSGCRKYLDVNQNPNIAQNVTPELLLPSAQIQIASAVGVDMQINGSFWAQYWTQSPNASQYRYLEQYATTASNYDRVWGLLYNGALADLRRLEVTAREANRNQYVAVAKLLEAYTFQLLTDGWGDIPVAEAIQGLPGDGGIVSPRYDPQSVVYDSIISIINQGLTIINETRDQHFIGTEDVIYGGDMDLWERFGNTLLLRVYLRLSERDPGKAQTGIQQLYARTGGNMFLDNGEDAQVNYISTAGNQNPLYAEMVALRRTQNLVASATVVDTMLANNDPRVFEFFTIVSGTVRGLQQGNFNSTTAGTLSTPSALVAGQATNAASAEAPVKLLTGYESLFLQAEAAARNWGTGSDEDLFEQGIVASFETYGLTTAEAQTYTDSSYWGMYPAGGSLEEKIRHIITQKWFSMTGNQGFEAWTEWRRTGYPNIFTSSVTSIIGNVFPQRFLYPNTEVTRNANFPGQTLITEKVWWDVKD